MPLHFLRSKAHTNVPHAVGHAALMSTIAICFAVLVSPTMLLLQQLEFNAQLTEYDVKNGMYNAYYSDNVSWTDEGVSEQTFDYDLYKAAIEYEITVRKSVAVQEFESLGLEDTLRPAAQLEQTSVIYPVRVMVATDLDNQIIASYQSPTGNESVSGPNPSIITYQQLTGVDLTGEITEQQAIEAGVIVPDPTNLLEFTPNASVVYVAEDEGSDPLVQALQAAREAKLQLAEVTIKKSNLQLAMTNHIAIGGAKVRNSQKAYQSAEQNLLAITNADASSFGGESQFSAVKNGAQAAVQAAQRNLVIQNGKFNDKVEEFSNAIAALKAAEAVAAAHLALAESSIESSSRISSTESSDSSTSSDSSSSNEALVEPSVKSSSSISSAESSDSSTSSESNFSSLRSAAVDCNDVLTCSTSSNESSFSSSSACYYAIFCKSEPDESVCIAQLCGEEG